MDANLLPVDRMENAADLLRYARWRVSLADRICLLHALDQEGSLSLVDCMDVLRSCTQPMAAIAALALQRHVSIDLDSGRLAPETRVTRHLG